MSLLGFVACLQIGALTWRFLHPPQEPAPAEEKSAGASPAASATPAPSEAVATTKPQETPAEATPSAHKGETEALAQEEQLAAEAEKQLLASQAEQRLLASLPRPTPVPIRRENPVEARINALLHLARTLRDRGDTSTALTRLREAQVISPENPQIISEMAMTYEKMGLDEKAFEQWRRIAEIGEKAGIFYAAAEAKLRAIAPAKASFADEVFDGESSLLPETGPREAFLSFGKIGTTDDTGNSHPHRQLKLQIPIQAKKGAKIDVHEVVIQVFFYDELKDGSVVETNAHVASSWARRVDASGAESPVDWSTSAPEILEVEYSQAAAEVIPTPAKSKGKNRRNAAAKTEAAERRNYFGYVVRVYYKGDLNASHAEPEKLLTQFPPPVTLPSSDLPQ